MEAAFILIAKITIASSMAVLYATIGEIFTERSGVLNLGVEGMMLIGALAAFAATQSLQSLWLGMLIAMLAGGLFAMIHGHSREICQDIVDSISGEFGLKEHMLLFSTREFKKTRVNYTV